MKWMKERDLLIAQTMAFVQSVTGKRPDADLPTAAPLATGPAEVPVKPVGSGVATGSPLAASPQLPTPTVIEVPPASVPAPAVATTVVEAAAVDAPAPAAQLPHFAKLDLRGDFQSEVRDRVANFRANQQRFLREREEYCTTTMDRVRAAIRDNSELPRSGK